MADMVFQYMRLMGGYDFPGSWVPTYPMQSNRDPDVLRNSNIDLQYVDLEEIQNDFDSVWQRTDRMDSWTCGDS